MDLPSLPAMFQKRYGLHKDPAVDSAARRTERIRRAENKKSSDEFSEVLSFPNKVPQNPTARIENYFGRFQEILDREDSESRKKGIDALKRSLYRKFIISPDQIPEDYIVSQQRIRGKAELREKIIERVITEQKESLNRWIDYFSDSDTDFPMWFRYWALRGVISSGSFDQARGTFEKRSKGTAKPFPFLDTRALQFTFEQSAKRFTKPTIIHSVENEEEDDEYDEDEYGQGFMDFYALGIKKAKRLFREPLTNAEGCWVKYEQGPDYKDLAQALSESGWCTAMENTAKEQLEKGDFYIYFSHDHNGQPTVPRAAIRMEGGKIAEVRGTESYQNVDEYVLPLVQEKLKDFSDGSRYLKKTVDTAKFLFIEKKLRKDPKAELSRDELAFLYEIDHEIESFGEYRDPRIERMISQRNHAEDLSRLFSRNEVAHSIDGITEETRIYIGSIEDGVLAKLPERITYVCTHFPYGRVRCVDFITNKKGLIGSLAREDAVDTCREKRIHLSQSVVTLAALNNFSARFEEKVLLRQMKIENFDFGAKPTASQIFEKAKKIGLRPLSIQQAMEYRIHNLAQPEGETVLIAVHDESSDSAPERLLRASRFQNGLSLDAIHGDGDPVLDEKMEIIFSLQRS